MKTTNTTELHKDKECVWCKKVFECDGKPRDVERCLNFEKDGEDNGVRLDKVK